MEVYLKVVEQLEICDKNDLHHRAAHWLKEYHQRGFELINSEFDARMREITN